MRTLVLAILPVILLAQAPAPSCHTSHARDYKMKPMPAPR
jgi:hypothetical protein